MRHMGGLKKHLPVTYVTMLIGTLAIAGMPPLSGFFSKDEILFKTFLANKVIWGVAVVTALMTAFYMYRLMSMTFFGNYRGPSWAHGGGHGHADAHGPAGAGAGHGHGAASEGGWHGPHESPKSMTVPLQILAVGAVLAGFVGIPAALGGGNAIEHFLEPSFVARTAASEHAAVQGTGEVPNRAEAAGEHAVPSPSSEGGSAAIHAAPGETAHHISWAAEMGLMGLSVLVGIIGILTAYRFYVRAPEIADRLAGRWSGAHRVLSNKYYVDEIYGATVVAGTLESARGLWAVDRNVVDGAVNGSGWLTVFSAWFSHLLDKYIVDGLVNLVGAVLEESSFLFRRLQTGLIQNYALVMLFGVFAFVSVYLIVR
jgi:NADH-quinone oxidoreductase subunit L